MRDKTVLRITKNGVDYGLTITAGSTGNDVIAGLAYAVAALYERERTVSPDYQLDGLVNYIKEYAKCVVREQ